METRSTTTAGGHKNPRSQSEATSHHVESRGAAYELPPSPDTLSKTQKRWVSVLDAVEGTEQPEQPTSAVRPGAPGEQAAPRSYSPRKKKKIDLEKIKIHREVQNLRENNIREREKKEIEPGPTEGPRRSTRKKNKDDGGGAQH
jgi:hypothetical protein